MIRVSIDGDQDGPYCASFQTAVELIGKRWNGAIVAVLLSGPRRFSELVSSVPGLSERLLSDRLRELQLRGLLVRRVLGGPPLGVEYELTAAGRDLAPVVETISAWAHHWLEGPIAADVSVRAEVHPAG
jgi:DNA-binding HxlR family transcriptional regulator